MVVVVSSRRKPAGRRDTPPTHPSVHPAAPTGGTATATAGGDADIASVAASVTPKAQEGEEDKSLEKAKAKEQISGGEGEGGACPAAAADGALPP